MWFLPSSVVAAFINIIICPLKGVKAVHGVAAGWGKSFFASFSLLQSAVDGL